MNYTLTVMDIFLKLDIFQTPDRHVWMMFWEQGEITQQRNMLLL